MRRDVNLFIHIQVLVQDILGQNDVLVGLIILRVLHLLDLNLALDLLSFLLLFFELGLLLKQLLLETSLDRFIHGTRLSLAVGAFLEIILELLLCLEKVAFLDHERVTLIQILEKRVVINSKLILFSNFFIRDQPIIANVDLIVAFRCLSLAIVKELIVTTHSLNSFSLCDSSAELIRLVLKLVLHALLGLFRELAFGA